MVCCGSAEQLGSSFSHESKAFIAHHWFKMFDLPMKRTQLSLAAAIETSTDAGRLVSSYRLRSKWTFTKKRKASNFIIKEDSPLIFSFKPDKGMK